MHTNLKCFQWNLYWPEPISQAGKSLQLYVVILTLFFSNKFSEPPFIKTGGQNIIHEQTREDFTYPSFCGGIGTLPSLFSFDSTDVTRIPLGCQTFFTLSTKSAVPFPSKNSSMLLFFIKNSAWYCGIPKWHIEKWLLFHTLWDMYCSPRPKWLIIEELRLTKTKSRGQGSMQKGQLLQLYIKHANRQVK